MERWPAQLARRDGKDDRMTLFLSDSWPKWRKLVHDLAIAN